MPTSTIRGETDLSPAFGFVGLERSAMNDTR